MRASTAVVAAIIAGAMLIAGCAKTEPGQGDARRGQSETSTQSRTVVIAFRNESTTLAPKIQDAVSRGNKELFNATLTGRDTKNVPQPWLADALPELRTDSWRVFPDGQMETTYRLRPGLTWHDDQPLTADDFVFAWRVYTDKGLGVFRPQPQNQMQEVLAPDPRTIVVRWDSPYPDADILTHELPPLPRHILEQPFADYQSAAAARDSFLNHPYWTTEYVQLGAYRLTAWEPNVALYAEAFSGYVFGRPRIDRLIARIMSDENTVLTNLLAGEVQLATPTALRFQHGLVLQRDWVPAKRGTVFWAPSGNPQNAVFQFRSEYQKTPALFDIRVRKALNYAIDRQAILDGLFEGQGVIAYTAVEYDDPVYAEVNRVITKYPYDQRMAETLMNEGGFSKDSQGFFADRSGERFRPDFQALAGETFERHQAIMAETWARAGIETVTSTITTSQQRDLVNRNTFPGIGQVGGANYATEQSGSPENRWTGRNLGGFSHPAYDALWQAFNTTLERPERNRLQVEMARFETEQVPGMMLYFNANGIAYATGLRGPADTVAANLFWNLHEWELW